MDVILGNCKNNPSCPHVRWTNSSKRSYQTKVAPYSIHLPKDRRSMQTDDDRQSIDSADSCSTDEFVIDIEEQKLSPCLLFERNSANGSKTGRRFFACSACRDRSECNFFQWADEEMTENVKKHWDDILKKKSASFSHEECMKRLEVFKSIPVQKRKYCQTCSLLILSDEENHHSSHKVLGSLGTQNLLHPSSFFEILENKRAEAQYFFTDSTVEFIVSLLKDLQFSKLILIGAPRIHEHVISKQVNGLSSFLMDIDNRYMQFFAPKQFCHYNMFNNHFFSGTESKRHFKNFLKEEQNEKVAIILDPPFGGLINAISFTLKNINKWWQKINNKMDESVPKLYIFPYFHEARILKHLPDMQMMDYKVEYINHKKFRRHDSRNSPVRIFTNISASNFVLPSEKGYWFCDKCERFVSQENQHCIKCNACTTKHGKTYHHCDQCNQCVKSSYIHCSNCDKCGLASDISEICKNCKCGNFEDGQNHFDKCFKCSGVGHRKRSCPEGIMRHNMKRKFQKKT